MLSASLRDERAAAAAAAVFYLQFFIFLVKSILILSLAVATANATTATTQQVQPQHPADNDSTTATRTASQLRLQQTTQDYLALQSELDTKFHYIQNVRNKIIQHQKRILSQQLRLSGEEVADGDNPTPTISIDAMHDDMDKIGSKVVELLRRTEDVLARVGAQNKIILSGNTEKVSAAAHNETVVATTQSGEDNNSETDANNTKSSLGLEARLQNLMKEEIDRRDRYYRISTSLDPKDNDVDNDNNVEDDASSSYYITLSELTQLLSYDNIVLHQQQQQHSQPTIQQSLLELTTQLMKTHVQNENSLWKHRSQQEVPNNYEEEYHRAMEEIQEQIQIHSNNRSMNTNGQCLTIPQSMEMVARALVEHYSPTDISTTMVDHASYENGGSVVYELTSGAYVPPPRNDNMDGRIIFSSGGGGGGINQRDQYEFMKQKLFDDHVETMYYQQRQQQQPHHHGPKGESFVSMLWNPLSDMFDKLDIWKWYTTFPLGTLRQYLPEDWERVLDRLFSSSSSSDRIVDGSSSSASWSDYTPRGIVDVLIPDYVYHALGLQNTVAYGRWFGRTASPEVAISDGYSKSGGGGGGSVGIGGKRHYYTAMPRGNCYPLSMRPEDDPALLLPSMLDHSEDNGGSPSSLLIGPKYTVRLPYPIYIDAVTFEHRSFPLLPSEQTINDRTTSSRSGKSAPRWIRVVGFPPCSRKAHGDEDYGDDEAEDGECAVRGFDIAKPIDLGSYEYQRIDESGDSDGVGEEGEGTADETLSNVLERRRSIQTFAVAGGRWKPPSLLINDSSEDNTEIDDEPYDSRDPRQCSEDSPSCDASFEADENDDMELDDESLPVGQCAPPKDVDSVPSCGADMTSSTVSETTKKFRGGGKTSAQARKLVEAVSFIIEENWGNREYTCLYRIRVHGDTV